MSTKQITDTLFQITRFGMINCYLVVEDDGATLVDTGMAGMGTGLVAVGRASRSSDSSDRPHPRPR